MLCKTCNQPLSMNINRKIIMTIIKHSKKQMNISDIHKKMDISYKSVYKNIEVLEKLGLVKLKKNPNTSGQAVTIKIQRRNK